MRHGRRGGAAAELAVVLPVLVTLMLGVFELSRVLNARHHVVAAAFGGAYAGSGIDAVGADVTGPAEAAALAILSDGGIACGAGCSVTASVTTDGGVDWVTVVVTAPYSPAVTAQWAPASLSASASAPLRRQP